MKLYTIKEVAKITGYKESYMRQLVFRKEIETIRINRSVRITKEALEKFIGLSYEEEK